MTTLLHHVTLVTGRCSLVTARSSSNTGVKSRTNEQANFYFEVSVAFNITGFFSAAEQGVCSLGRSSIVVEYP